MKKLMYVGLLLGMSILVRPPSTLAISLDFVPAAQTVLVGELFSVDVVISGLENESPPQIVGAFDLDVLFDPALLSPLDVLFDTLLGGPALSFQAFTFPTPGVVDLAEVSLLSDAELDLLQPDSFRLATLTFTSLDVGTSPLAFRFVDPSDPFNINDIKGLDAQVLPLDVGSGNVSTVPEPGTLVLLGSGLGALGLRSWRRNRRNRAPLQV